MGNEGGLSEYNYQTDKFIRLTQPGNIKDIEFDKYGFIWLATSGNGLFKFDPSHKSLKQFSTHEGLSHNFVFGIAMDRNGLLWMNTEAGLSRFNPYAETFRNYDMYDGLPDDHFDDKSEAVLADGKIYMGTSNGFVVFNPEEIKDDTSQSKVVLTDILIHNKSISQLPDNEYEAQFGLPVGQMKTFRLRPDQHTFSLVFAALNYSVPHKIKYAYKLDGFDKDWNYTNARNPIARYTNMDGGNYRFLVKATNCDGVWTDVPLKIGIKIFPPFYKTLWFRITAVLFLMLLVVIIFRRRISREVIQKEKLALMVEKRTREVTEKNKLLETSSYHLKSSNKLLAERQHYIEEQSEAISKQRDELADLNATKDKLFSIIAHDLKTPFNVIMGFSELLLLNFESYSVDKQKELIRQINQSSQKTLILLDNLLQWSRSQQSSVIFNPIAVKIEKIVENSIEEVRDITENKNIEVYLRVGQNKLYVLSDANMMNTVMRNLLTNAVKFSNKGSSITVRISKTDDQKSALIAVVDKGVGMSKEAAANLFRIENNQTTAGTMGEKGTGLGLILCKDFVELHKGKIWVESEEGAGAAFYFTLPLADQSDHK